MYTKNKLNTVTSIVLNYLNYSSIQAKNRELSSVYFIYINF